MVVTPVFIITKLACSVITIAALLVQIVFDKNFVINLIATVVVAMGFSASGVLYISTGGAYALFGAILIAVAVVNVISVSSKIYTLAEELKYLQTVVEKTDTKSTPLDVIEIEPL